MAWFSLHPFLVRLLLIRQWSRWRWRRQIRALADLCMVEGNRLGKVRESEKQVEKCDSLLKICQQLLFVLCSVHEE